MLGPDAQVGDELVAATLLLGSLVLVRCAVVAALPRARQVPRLVGRALVSLGLAVRPRVAGRVVAAALGVGGPVVTALVGPTAASAHSSDAPRVAAPAPRPVTPPHVPAATSPAAVYVVRAGDTLWDVARRHLHPGAGPADVARAWPRWFAINRAVIGPDPSLLRPGMRLHPPGPPAAGTPLRANDRPPATRDDSRALARTLDPDRR